MSGQKATDRHDIVARVFRLKVQKLMNVVTIGKVFGHVQRHMYSVEWQKRGLPHVHILIWLKQKLLPNQIDKIISAEIPDPEEDKNLYDTVIKNMIHGPCGARNPASPCMQNGKCTKKYPRELIRETVNSDKGYPLLMVVNKLTFRLAVGKSRLLIIAGLCPITRICANYSTPTLMLKPAILYVRLNKFASTSIKESIRRSSICVMKVLYRPSQ